MRGHIRKRGSRWCVVVDVGHEEGGERRQRWHSGFTTRRDAQAALTMILGQVQQGAYVETHKQTMANFLGEWLESIRAAVRPSTWNSYRDQALGHIAPRLGAVRLQSLTPALLNGLYADLLAGGRRDGKGGLSPRSVRYIHTIAHQALAEAVRWGRLTRNPADLASPPRRRVEQQLHTWTADELRGFLESVQKDRLHAAYVLAATTGMRRGEVLGLRWQDVDLKTARIAVVQTLVRTGDGIDFSTPKTPKGRRSVALDPQTTAILQGHRRAQLEERMALGLGSPGDAGLVFTSVNGAPITPSQLSHAFEARVKAAGLPRIRFHDLRHTHATLALQAGVHPKVVSERLGHSTVSITLDTYSHAVPALEEEAAAKVARLVFG